jgi:hypothetical protein
LYIGLQPPFLLRGVRDIGWEHAVDLDGNKKRWQCKWCDLCRSGGVTTLKAHLTDSSCPKIPIKMSKQVLNFIEEKRAARQLFNKDPWPAYKKIDWVCGFCSESEKEGTVPCKNDQQPSNNAMHMLTSKKCAIDEVYELNNFILADTFTFHYTILPPFSDRYDFEHFQIDMILNVRHSFFLLWLLLRFLTLKRHR